MTQIVVTGGGGFIGSHVAEYYAKQKENRVIIIDNLSRAKLLHRDDKNAMYNWNYLHQYKNIKFYQEDIKDFNFLKDLFKKNEIDTLIHTAGQTAVTTSVTDPKEDFENNLIGTYNILEAVRISKSNPAIVFCSTNKVFGNNVNECDLEEKETRYEFTSEYKNGISEEFSTDLCEHTPYGASKFCADVYAQEYGHIYGLKTGVFRMSCLTGDTIIQTILGSKKIIDIDENDILLSFDGKKIVFSNVIKQLRTNSDNKILYKITTRRNHIIKATGDHRFYTPNGFKRIDSLNYGELICIYPQIEKEYIDFEDNCEILVTKDDIYKNLKKLNIREITIQRKIKSMEEKGLLPFSKNARGYQRIIELVGYCFGDANLYTYQAKNRNNISLALQIYGKEEEINFIKKILDSLGIPHSKEQITISKSKLTNGRVINGKSIRIVITQAEYSSLFQLLGVPLGDKALKSFNIPNWILESDRETRRCFLRGLFSAELARITYTDERYGGLSFAQSKDEKLGSNLYDYLNTIKKILLQEFGAKTSEIFNGGDYKRKSGVTTIQRVFKIYAGKKNRTNFAKVGFACHPYRNSELYNFMEWDKSNEKSFKKWFRFYNKNLPKELLWDNIIEIKQIEMEDIYDITVENTHNFIANGFLVHNCIYGTRQFGFEDQGWVAHFVISAILNKKINIFGDGKQVRDLLYVSDLIDAYDKFIKNSQKLKHEVFCMGGGKENTLSLLELISILKNKLDKKINIEFFDWRPSDQKVYISDISKAKQKLNWNPKINPQEGIEKLINWTKKNKKIF